MAIYMMRELDTRHFATQGPCPDEFHVPLNDEWTSLNNMGISLGAWSSNNLSGMITYLKLPLAGRRNYDSTSKATQGDGNYWSSSWDSNGKFKWAYIYTSMIEVGTGTNACYGASIRPFRNAIVIPDNSWTVLYQGTGVSGIYHNTTLGLISISSDGTNWITISDKNCGASTVWNSGDNLSDDNCGKFYQAGNNYGFPRTGTVTTSSSRVNAGTYGPGNYYESSTFITGSGGWDSSINKNLRGGEDGNVPV